MILLSINRGEAAPIRIGSAEQISGIRKSPVSGRVRVQKEGIEKDFIADTRHHGGEDQAVYLYSQEDYDWWSTELDRPLAHGLFGENLVVSSFGAGDVRVGDRFNVGDVLLEVSGPRIPCATLAARMEEPTFVRRFAAAVRPGAYARVLLPGFVESGQPIELIPAHSDNCTVNELFRLWYSNNRARARLEHILKAPLATRLRSTVEGWIPSAGD